jgi:hypothetical protein
MTKADYLEAIRSGRLRYRALEAVSDMAVPGDFPLADQRSFEASGTFLTDRESEKIFAK